MDEKTFKEALAAERRPGTTPLHGKPLDENGAIQFETNGQPPHEPIPDPAPAQNLAMVYRPTWRQRFVRWLFPSNYENRAQQWGYDVGFPIKDGVVTRTTIFLSWKDRLRILISGRASLDSTTHCENVVGKTHTAADFNVLPPAWMDKEGQ